MSWQILVTAKTFDAVGAAALALLTEAGCTLHRRLGPLEEAALLDALPGMDAVLATVDAYTARVLESHQASQLKIVSRWGVGYDTVDVAAATRAGIAVAYTPGLLDHAVADYTFALLLSAARRVHEVHQAMGQGRWSATWGHDVTGKNLGIIGCGRIGLAVARRAAGFDLRVLGYDCTPSAAAREAGIRFVALPELLAQSDFVCLHAALTSSSRGLIGERELRAMKPTALLINTGRGPLIDEAALARALHESWIAGAALDVYATEPLPADNPLRHAPNVLLSPHQSSFARDTGERVSRAAAQALLDLQQNRRPPMIVNPEVFTLPHCRVRTS